MKCNLCDYENKENEHYCVNCGKNLSSQIEKTDFLFGISSFLKIISIFSLILVCPGVYLFESISRLDNFSSNSNITLVFAIVSIAILFFSIFIKEIAKDMCIKNIKKEKEMKTIEQINIDNKKVILRVDYNVPIKDGKVIDNNRIKQSLDTIKYLKDHNAKIILLSHLGKVKTEEDKEKNTLLPVKTELEHLLNETIEFSTELKGSALEEKINKLKPKEIILLENTRHMDYPNKLESNCDKELSSYWASLGEIYILDAFGSAHRAHASTYGISEYLPHAIGFLIEKEIKELNNIKDKEKTIILGGAKVSDKIGVIKNLLPTSNKILIGGAMCGTFLKSQNINVGKTFVEEEKIEEVKLLKTNKIILPIDVITENGTKEIEKITDEESILDVGPKTIEKFKQNLTGETLVLMNGTLGLYENPKYENGTKEIFKYLETNKIDTIVCGGDTGNATKKYNFAPYYLSTGGGASLEYLEGKELPSLKIMEKMENKNE